MRNFTQSSFRATARLAAATAVLLLATTAASAQIPPATSPPENPPTPPTSSTGASGGPTVTPTSPALPGDTTTGDRTPTLAQPPQTNPAATPAPGAAASAAAGGEVSETGTSLLDTHMFGGNDLRHADREFARIAVTNNLQAEELGRLALAKAANPAVKSFAKTLADDSDKLHVQLLVAGNAAGVTFPGELGKESRTVYRSLAALSGADFDRAFLDEVVKRHAADLAAFEREAASRRAEVNLRKFATATVPVLKQQIDAAKGLQGMLAGATTPPAGGGAH
jgi:putative membrane protein